MWRREQKSVCAQFPLERQHVLNSTAHSPFLFLATCLAQRSSYNRSILLLFFFKFVGNTLFLLITKITPLLQLKWTQRIFSLLISTVFGFRFVLPTTVSSERKIMCTIMVDGKHQIMWDVYALHRPPYQKLGDREGNWQTKIEPGEKETEFKRKRQTLKMKWGKGWWLGRGQCIHWCLARVPLWRQGHHRIRGLDSDPKTDYLWAAANFRTLCKLPKSW